MKKIILKSPVDFLSRGGAQHFAPGREYTVPDDVAQNSFLSTFLTSVVDVPSDPVVQPAEAPKQPQKTVRRRRRVASE